MKIWIMSDLHQEFPVLRWIPRSIPEHDVLVLAGDIHNGLWQTIGFAMSITEKPVIIVAGNHEFYGRNRPEEIVTARELSARDSQIHFLDKDELDLGGVRFLGTTLWTDFCLFDRSNMDTCMDVARNGLNDFAMIREAGIGPKTRTPFTPELSVDLHKQSLAWLESRLRHQFEGSTVVVTHHAPHPASVAGRYAVSALTAAFVSDLSGLIDETRPAMWIHGHVHDRFDYAAKGGTRIVANPRGYSEEISSLASGGPAWNDALVIDTDDL